MIWLVLVLLAAFLVGCMIWKGSQPDAPSEVDPEQAVKAAVELHAIRRRLDVAWVRSQQRREGAALRRKIAEVLREPEDDD